MLIEGLLEVVIGVVYVSWSALGSTINTFLHFKHWSLYKLFCFVLAIVKDLHGTIVQTCEEILLSTTSHAHMLDSLHSIGDLDIELLFKGSILSLILSGLQQV